MKLFLRFAPTARAGLVGLALVGSLAYNLVHERTTAIEGARTQTQNFARVLEEHARQTLHRVGSNLARADVTLGRLRAAGVVDRSVLGKELSDELPSDQLIRSFLLLDATGAVVLSTRAERAALPALMAQRDFFVPHVRGADRELVFGAVQKDADDGRWLLPVSRRIGTPAGSFVGVLVAMVDTGYFQSFYDSVDHGGDGFLTLFLTSGWAAVSSPRNESVLSQNWLHAPMFREHLPSWPTGTVRQVVARDGIERIYSYRVLNDYPVVVSYGLSLAAVLADWRTSAWRDASLLLLMLVALALAALRLSRNERSRLASQRVLAETQERFHSLIDSSPVGIAVHREGDIVYVNPAMVRMMGAATADELEGRQLLDFVHPDYRRLVMKRARRALARGLPQAAREERFLRLDGVAFDAEVQSAAISFEGVLATQVIVQDISQRKQAEANLRIAAAAFESQEGIIVTDASNVILRVNSAFTAITGYSAQEAVGRTPSMLQSGRQNAAFYATMWRSVQSTGSWQGELWSRRKSGQEYLQQTSITAVKEADGTLTHYVVTSVDITLSRAASDEIEQLAFYDPLTSLPNRRLLMDRLRQALLASARHSRHGALLFLDLDHFKTLNDTLGHDQGDLLLQQVARRLCSVVRDGDTVARLGGDEFVVLLENLSEQALEAADQTQSIGEKILAILNLSYQLGSHQHLSTASIGAVLFRGHQQALEDLLKQTDLAMYAAKSAGRNAIRFFDPQMQASITERTALEDDLRVALVQQQFRLYYQKQVTHDGRAIGAEVLIHWLHPVRGLVAPGSFIAHAEEIGQIVPIGQWVLQSACEQLKAWETDPLFSALALAVNVSARQFRQDEFVQQVQCAIKNSGARADRLKLEITESTVLDNVHDTIAKMLSLKAIGVRFSIDDFGTGQSSLSYLTQLPLDQLKIDQSFVHNIGIRPVDALIAQTIIGMGNNLRLEVIAEGVETEAQRAFLEEHGCLLCQGYWFGRPAPLDEFEASLRAAG